MAWGKALHTAQTAQRPVQSDTMAAPIARFNVGDANNNNNDLKTKAMQDEEAAARVQKMRIAIGCLVAYFVVGAIAFMVVFEQFTFTDAFYFLMVTLTTVGYGDGFYPTTQGGRLFTSFFVLFGISIVAVALVEVANYMIEEREALIKKTQAEVIKNAGDDAKNGRAATVPGAEDPDAPMAKLKAFLAANPVIEVLFKLGSFVCIAGGIFAAIEGWDFVDGMYFTVITGTTVGYGDVTPHTGVGKWCCFFFLPFAVIFTSTQLSALANVLLGKSEDAKLKSLLAVDLSIEALLNMDTDGDGEITEFEFIKFMMTSAGMADGETLDALHKRFTEMDADGSGALTKEDILLILKEKEEAEAALAAASEESKAEK